MADVVVDFASQNSKELLGQGIRAYVLEDYSSAVAALSQASELLVEEHKSDLHDDLADVYLYYGKALLGLSREESGPLGDAVPKNSEEDSDEDVENIETEEANEDEKTEADAVEVNGETTGNDDTKMEVGEEQGTSNGTADDASGSAALAVDDETPEDEEATDLQVAWEVLELAKKIYERHGDTGRKNLADTLIVLGEVSLESENFEAAISDIKSGLSIQKELFGKDSRTVAETYYKLGVAYATNSEIDEAIQSFKDSLEYLQHRIAHLEKMEERKDEIEDEIKEIKNLMPDIEEKISDMKTYKDEALKKIISAVTDARLSTDASASTSTAVSSPKPATDISHLVKRKRKLEEIVEENDAAEASPAKKTSK